MTIKDKEHYELMAMFEREFKGYGRLAHEQDKKMWAIGNVYEDGHVNQLFLAYRKGYALGKVA